MFCLVLSDHATTVARAYGLGAPVREMIMVARGEQGRVWRLDTDTSGFAIKELVIRQTPDERPRMSPIRRPCSLPARCRCHDLSARWPVKS
jgi:hypothetical protein